MKTAKLVLGILSIVLSFAVWLQSCGVALLNKHDFEYQYINAAAGMVVSFFMLAAGIVGLCTRRNKAGGITAGALYIFGGFVGLFTTRTINGLLFWVIVSIAFGTVFLVGSIFMGGKRTKIEAEDA